MKSNERELKANVKELSVGNSVLNRLSRRYSPLRSLKERVDFTKGADNL